MLRACTNWRFSHGITALWYVLGELPFQPGIGLTTGPQSLPQQTRTAKGFVFLSFFFFLLVLPISHLASKEGQLVRQAGEYARVLGFLYTRDQLKGGVSESGLTSIFKAPAVREPGSIG